MRDLTEEELKLAPGWATHYHANLNGSILFECKDRCCLYEKEGGLTRSIECNGVCKESKPIHPKKPFDISEHEFSDSYVYNAYCGSGNLSLFEDTGLRMIKINKEDAIAIAKALGVTGEDLL